MRKYNTAIFVHGCFWHRHEGCKYAYMPKSRVEFWQKKFDANIKRDEYVRKELMRKKVKVVIVWEVHNKENEKKMKNSEKINCINWRIICRMNNIAWRFEKKFQ